MIKVDRMKIEKCFMALQYAERIPPNIAQYFRVFTVFYNSTAAHYPSQALKTYNNIQRNHYTHTILTHVVPFTAPIS